MNLAFGILFIWVGAAMIWIATHGTDASTPWEAYQQIITGIRKGVEG